MSEFAGPEALEPEECLRLLASVPVGRVAFTRDALPAIQPVNFVVADGAVVIRTAPGAKLSAALDNTVVAFEADDIALDKNSGWSVTVVGRAEVVDGPAAVELAGLPLQPWAPGVRDQFVRIPIDLITGRRLPGA